MAKVESLVPGSLLRRARACACVCVYVMAVRGILSNDDSRVSDWSPWVDGGAIH